MNIFPEKKKIEPLFRVEDDKAAIFSGSGIFEVSPLCFFNFRSPVENG